MNDTQMLAPWELHVYPLKMGWRYVAVHQGREILDGYGLTQKRAIQNANASLRLLTVQVPVLYSTSRLRLFLDMLKGRK